MYAKCKMLYSLVLPVPTSHVAYKMDAGQMALLRRLIRFNGLVR